MSVTIPRHSSPGPDDECYAERLGRSVVKGVQRLEQSPGSLDMTLGTALLHLQARCAVDPQAARLETREYWTADEERAKDPEGRIALAPLAITCLAHDGGIPIEVQSDYLPKHLLQRGWLGEFEV